MAISVRNNNPGALMYASWEKAYGAVPGGKNVAGTLARFPTPAQGYAAAAQWHRRAEARGMTTLRQRMSVYAPANGAGNSKASFNAYLNKLATAMGITPDTPFSIDDPNVGPKLLLAHAQFESGMQNPFPAGALEEGYKMGPGAAPNGAAPDTAAMGNASGPTIRRGDYKGAVADWQNNLNALGFGPINPDGKFGRQTEQATKAFQATFGLSQDGVVGPQTRAAASNFAAMQGVSAPNGSPMAAPVSSAAFGFGPKLPPAALFPSGGPTPPASIPTPYMGNGPGRSPTGPAPVAMSPTLGTKDDTVAPSDPALTASNPFQMPQPWGPVADQSVQTLPQRLPAPTPAVGFGLQSSKGDYVSIPRSMWTGDSSTMRETYRDPLGMPSPTSLPASVPFGFAQAGGAGNVMNGADVSGGRNLALMGRAPVNMANAAPAATTTPALMRDQANAQSFGNFLRSIGTAFGGASSANASVPSTRYDPLSSARMPLAPAMPAINRPAPATITPQQFQQRFAPMGAASIPQDVTYRVASLNPVVSNSVSMAPKTISKADFNARFGDAPTSKLAPSPFALGGGAAGVVAPPSAGPLGTSLALAGGMGIGVPQEPAPVPMTPMRRVARVAVPIAASMALGPVAGLAARGIMSLVNGGPLANRVGQAIAYANAAPRSNPYAASPFTPAGFTAPNFSPKGGGSTYAYQTTAPGVGSYINSAGRTINYNVNADQRVYGGYAGGFGGFQP